MNSDFHKILENMYAAGERIAAAKQAGKPEVGPFWLLDNGRLLVEGLPITEAQEVMGYKVNPRDHGTIWKNYQRVDVVPKEQNYNDLPRGRVTYVVRIEKYVITADRCILNDPSIMAKVKADMNLPPDTLVEDDSHYVCDKCKKSWL
jgi:hypothetical protein